MDATGRASGERIAVAAITRSQRLTTVVHRRAETGGAECGFYVMLPSPFPPFTVCAHSRLEVFGGGVAVAVLFALWHLLCCSLFLCLPVALALLLAVIV